MLRAANQRPAEQARLILDNLGLVADDLDAGAIVVLGEATLRIHRLPQAGPADPPRSRRFAANNSEQQPKATLDSARMLLIR